MDASELSKRLSPFLQLINKKALSPSYRALMLAGNFVRGASQFGTMEVEVDLGIGEDTEIYVDGEEFLQVLRSLPKEELELEIDDNVLSWRCSRANGKLALMSDKISLPELPDDFQPEYEVGDDFTEALQVGSLSAGTTALLSVGLYGVHIDNKSKLAAYATDDRTISTTTLGDKLKDSSDKAILSPDAITLLCSVAKNGAMLGFDDKMVYCNTETTRLVLRQIQPLKHDVKKLISGFLDEEMKAPLDRDIISTFIKRADALSEERGKAEVAIAVHEGKVMLAFESGKSSSEEFFLVEGEDESLTVDPIMIEARRISGALAHADSLVFDYAKKGVLVLRGDHDFAFVISSRKT